ncbi:MAG: hypothetical protein OEW67_01805, partial [Cyclobacteriaceae bacterium]|nr:hypothetical protein [Cyclobacteriaceae bacterium]
ESTFKTYLYWLRENTFKEIVDSGLMSRRTAYRYRKLCKELKISDVNSENSIKSLASLKEYVFFIRSNYGKLKNLH